MRSKFPRTAPYFVVARACVGVVIFLLYIQHIYIYLFKKDRYIGKNSMCLVRRFWGDSAEQAKKCSTPSDQSVASGKRPTLSSELMRRSRKLTVPTNPDRSWEVRPGPNGRGAERGGRVVEKNCIMWVDTSYSICYTIHEGVPDGAIRGGAAKKCCHGNEMDDPDIKIAQQIKVVELEDDNNKKVVTVKTVGGDSNYFKNLN